MEEILPKLDPKMVPALVVINKIVFSVTERVSIIFLNNVLASAYPYTNSAGPCPPALRARPLHRGI